MFNYYSIHMVPFSTMMGIINVLEHFPLIDDAKELVASFFNG